MISNHDCIIYLYEQAHVSRKNLHKLIKLRPDGLYLAIVNQDAVLTEHLTKTVCKAMHQALTDRVRLNAYLKAHRPYKTWTYVDADYPVILKKIPDPPVVLYGLGDLTLLENVNRLSVIGTRMPSIHAEQRMLALLLPLVESFIFVSGLAKGIDGFAHKIACKYGGKTIAVIASGFLHPYPKAHVKLYDYLKTHQLVLSEYPVNKKPMRYHFPERNRIISALSFGTLIIEAKQKSGTMITADQALEQGRVVMAVPGDILNPNTEGCHNLIQQGAKLVKSTEDIIEEWSDQSYQWTLMHRDESL